jgi:hypothetical protein
MFAIIWNQDPDPFMLFFEKSDSDPKPKHGVPIVSAVSKNKYIYVKFWSVLPADRGWNFLLLLYKVDKGYGGKPGLVPKGCSHNIPLRLSIKGLEEK